MNIVAFFGSPRIGGNTDLLLGEVIRGLGTAAAGLTRFDLNLMEIQPCQNCGGCDETGECVLRDDMDRVYPAIRTAERIVLAAPIFFSGVSAQAKAMIDRCQALWCEKYLLNRPIVAGPGGRRGLFVTVGGMKMARHAECANSTATAFFRTVSVPEHLFLPYRGVDAKGAILHHPTAMREAFEAGQALARP